MWARTATNSYYGRSIEVISDGQESFDVLQLSVPGLVDALNGADALRSEVGRLKSELAHLHACRDQELMERGTLKEQLVAVEGAGIVAEARIAALEEATKAAVATLDRLSKWTCNGSAAMGSCGEADHMADAADDAATALRAALESRLREVRA